MIEPLGIILGNASESGTLASLRRISEQLHEIARLLQALIDRQPKRRRPQARPPSRLTTLPPARRRK